MAAPPKHDNSPSPDNSLQRSTPSAPRFVPYHTQKHHVTRGRYITSNDPRGYLPVFEYPLNGQWIMMDCDDGYILWTGIWKALGNHKADIVKMVESQPDLAAQLRRVRGGYLKIQGTWMPYEVALRLARRVAWPIREDLVPLFGPNFPETCLTPDQPGYGSIIPPNPRRKTRRSLLSLGLPPTQAHQPHTHISIQDPTSLLTSEGFAGNVLQPQPPQAGGSSTHAVPPPLSLKLACGYPFSPSDPNFPPSSAPSATPGTSGNYPVQPSTSEPPVYINHRHSLVPPLSQAPVRPLHHSASHPQLRFAASTSERLYGPYSPITASVPYPPSPLRERPPSRYHPYPSGRPRASPVQSTAPFNYVSPSPYETVPPHALHSRASDSNLYSLVHHTDRDVLHRSRPESQVYPPVEHHTALPPSSNTSHTPEGSSDAAVHPIKMEDDYIVDSVTQTEDSALESQSSNATPPYQNGFGYPQSTSWLSIPPQTQTEPVMQYMYEPVSQYQDPGSGFTEPSGGSPDTPWSIDMRESAAGVTTASTQGHVGAAPTYPPYTLASFHEDSRPNTSTGLATVDLNASTSMPPPQTIPYRTALYGTTAAVTHERSGWVADEPAQSASGAFDSLASSQLSGIGLAYDGRVHTPVGAHTPQDSAQLARMQEQYMTVDPSTQYFPVYPHEPPSSGQW